MSVNKKIHIVGGGTVFHVRNHLALAAMAYGATAKQLVPLCKERFGDTMDVELHLTKMADPQSKLETWDHLHELATKLIADPLTKIIIFSPAIVDFAGSIDDSAGKYDSRLSSKKRHAMELDPLPKIISRFRNERVGEMGMRKDILLVGFKTTCGATPQEQYEAGLLMLKRSGCNLVLANDTKTRRNMIIVPEEARYHETYDRKEVLENLVDMIYLRSHLTFTRSTVIEGEPVSWSSFLVPDSLRTVVNHCIAQGAYKRVNGSTAGHFAVKINENTFLSSIRKRDFNELYNVGLVKVITDGPDSVIAYGSKPSVGGQSQRILFKEHGEYDCIVHFHCPIFPDSVVPTVSQREFECGSHECGQNTSQGLKKFGNLGAVYLDSHGPNIAFNRSVDPQEVIRFIEENFNLSKKTGGYQIGEVRTGIHIEV